MLRHLNIFFGFLAILIGFSCATPGRPTGGLKDETPPVPMHFSPKNFSTDFNARTITVKFDENIQLRNLNQQLVVSPPMARPQISSNNRTLTIRLQDTLRSNSTYVFSFGDAVVDLNEGNVLPNFQYVFSTGKTIDSLSVVGEVLDAFTLQPVKNVSMTLLENLDSLSSRSARPMYIAKADADGFFRFDFLHDGCFYLAAINDQNNDGLTIPYKKSWLFCILAYRRYILKNQCVQQVVVPSKTVRTSTIRLNILSKNFINC